MPKRSDLHPINTEFAKVVRLHQRKIDLQERLEGLVGQAQQQFEAGEVAKARKLLAEADRVKARLESLLGKIDRVSRRKA